MLKDTALAHYGNNHTRLADALGITRSAVSQWGAIVPLASALRLERKTGGRLKTNWALYEPKKSDESEAA